MSDDLVDILFSYESDASCGWSEVVALFKDPAVEQLVDKIGCSKLDAEELLEGFSVKFKDIEYYIVSYLVE